MSPTQVIEIWQQTRNKKKFQDSLAQLGFKYHGCGKMSTVWTRDDVDYVVKIGTGCVTHKFKEPTLEQFRLPYIYTNGNRCIGIQLKANTTKEDKYQAYKKISEEASMDIELYDYDIHQDNVGLLNGKPVIFDYV